MEMKSKVVSHGFEVIIIAGAVLSMALDYDVPNASIVILLAYVIWQIKDLKK